jgi:phosphoribosyl 1,2-cyclic phosphodiesterase
MPVQFAMLASGSRGNAALIQSAGAGLLIDVGLAPRKLGKRLMSVDSAWERIGCVLLTHTHGDHVDNSTLHWMQKRGIALVCHEGHHAQLTRHTGFQALSQARLARTYDDRPFLTSTGVHIEPVRLTHDSGPTFGFRIEAKAARKGRAVAIGYVADTGNWSGVMADAMAHVDLLAVEFNHDVALQRGSGRAPALIARVLGDEGHLSNEQGAGFVSAVLERSRGGSLRHVVLLHLSEECNRPELAYVAARGAIRTSGRRVEVHTAQQRAAFPDLRLAPARRRLAMAN